MPKVAVGDRAPDFSLHSQSDEEVRLSDYLGKKNVVLYFYPKDFTPGCTAEAKGFRDSYQEFSDGETEVIGVSSDSVETHSRFSQECSLPFKLLSDPGKEAAGALRRPVQAGPRGTGDVRDRQGGGGAHRVLIPAPSDEAHQGGAGRLESAKQTPKAT